MRLHTYYRSSASYRVRIALKLKGLRAEESHVHLSKNGGEQFGAAYDALNPQHLLPALEVDGRVLTQSLAIIEYLDETRPAPPLLPPDAAGSARVRALSQAIAADIHPINNLRVLKYLGAQLGASQDVKNAWYRHWVALGLDALERQLAGNPATGLPSLCWQKIASPALETTLSMVLPAQQPSNPLVVAAAEVVRTGLARLLGE